MMFTNLLATSYPKNIEIAKTRSSSIDLGMPGSKVWGHQAKT
jgi:hypothetical protein